MEEHDSKRRRKSSSSSSNAIPEGNLTADRLETFLALPDRQKICWALQTETRLRLSKVENPYGSSYSETLRSGQSLFELYPKSNQDDRDTATKRSTRSTTARASSTTLFDRDLHEYQRKSLAFMRQGRHPDSSWNALPPLSILGHEVDPNALKHEQVSLSDQGPGEEEDSKIKSTKVPGPSYDTAPVPPNLLFFRILLESYMGYPWPSYNSPDATLPRCAVMGGAMVAALSAWRHKEVVQSFQKANLERFFKKFGDKFVQREIDEYHEICKGLRLQLNNFFIYKFKKSAFADGDVDIFCQVSPASRVVVKSFMEHCGMQSQIIQHIFSYLENDCGEAPRDQARNQLQRMAQTVVDHMIAQDEDFAEWHPDRINRTRRWGDMRDMRGLTFWRNGSPTGLLYALTHNGLSFQLAVKDPKKYESKLWPRSSQMIMLKPKADLLGGLLDFDISTVTAAYDGTVVAVTPRAALSLLTLTQVVTPFILMEGRNRQRIVKYWKRGFAPFMIDPNCFHAKQCVVDGESLVFQKLPPQFNPEPGQGHPRDTMQLQNHPILNTKRKVGHTAVAELDQFQRGNGVTVCCHRNHEPCCNFSFVLFEKEEDDAMRVLARCNRWSDEWRAIVEGTDPRLRVACSECRFRYHIEAVVELAEPTFDEFGKDDDVLHEPACQGWKSEEARDIRRNQRHRVAAFCSFYCGPSFDSRLARQKNYNLQQALGTLVSKAKMERERHKIKCRNQPATTYQPRFVFGSEIDEVFRAASRVNFPTPSRPPVGLNPERFAAKCEGCNVWLLDCEFGTKLCTACHKMTPAAATAVV